MLVFESVEEETRVPGKKKNSQSRVQNQQNSAHLLCRVWESKLGHIGGGRALSPLHQPCSPQRTLHGEISTEPHAVASQHYLLSR